MKTSERIKFNLAVSILFGGFGLLFTGSWAAGALIMIGWWIGMVLYVGIVETK